MINPEFKLLVALEGVARQESLPQGPPATPYR